jgi:hypothetical protein
MKTLNKLQQLSCVIRHEFRIISTSYSILLVLLGGILVYGLLYNYMYAPNIVTDAPVTVVDHSQSQVSRNFIRWLEAAPQTSVFNQSADFQEAKDWMKTGRVKGIVYFPRDFEQRMLSGSEAVVSLYASTSALLNYEALDEATTNVMLAMNDKYRLDNEAYLPIQGLVAVATQSSIDLSGTALYNYTEGYGSYLIPAVMMIIIFQTLVMVIAMISGKENENKSLSLYYRFGKSWAVAMRVVLGKTFVYCTMYAIFSGFLLGLLPHFFSIPNIGNGVDIALLLIPYLLSTSFMALAASRFFTDSEAPILMITFFRWD